MSLKYALSWDYSINEQHWSAEPSVQARCVRFSSCLYKVWSHVSEAVLLALRTFVALFCHYNSSSDSKASLHFIAFSGFPTAVNRAFLCFDAKAWPQSQTGLFTCTTVLHCGHTFLRLIRRSNLWYCTVDIPFWTSRKGSHKHLHVSSAEKLQYHVLQLT